MVVIWSKQLSNSAILPFLLPSKKEEKKEISLVGNMAGKLQDEYILTTVNEGIEKKKKREEKERYITKTNFI